MTTILQLIHDHLAKHGITTEQITIQTSYTPRTLTTVLKRTSPYGGTYIQEHQNAIHYGPLENSKPYQYPSPIIKHQINKSDPQLLTKILHYYKTPKPNILSRLINWANP